VTEPSSQEANRREFITGRTLTLAQLDACLLNSEVQNRFTRYSTVGRNRQEGSMSETEALEEAMMDVFVGAKNRGYRLYRNYATPEHVKRLKLVMKNAHEGMTVTEYLPDMVDLRARLRSTNDMGVLTTMLVAEQAGRNDDGEARESAVKAILARIQAIQVNEETVSSHEGPSEEELATASSKD